MEAREFLCREMRWLTKRGEERNEGRKMEACGLQLGFSGLTVVWRYKGKQWKATLECSDIVNNRWLQREQKNNLRKN